VITRTIDTIIPTSGVLTATLTPAAPAANVTYTWYREDYVNGVWQFVELTGFTGSTYAYTIADYQQYVGPISLKNFKVVVTGDGILYSGTVIDTLYDLTP
jgi:hypothetical protein